MWGMQERDVVSDRAGPPFEGLGLLVRSQANTERHIGGAIDLAVVSREQLSVAELVSMLLIRQVPASLVARAGDHGRTARSASPVLP
jgi:hypothetical protein